MKLLKKYWYLLAVLLITLGLGALTFITSQQLSNKQTITAPKNSKAATAACTLTFRIAQPACNSICDTNADCLTGQECATVGTEKRCRNPLCTNESTCVCSPTSSPTPSPTLPPGVTPTRTPTPTHTPVPTRTPTPTATPSPTSSPTPSPTLPPGVTPSVTPIPTATPTVIPPSGCNGACTTDAQCTGGMTCSGGVCRNPACTNQPTCICPVATNTIGPTPTPTQRTVANAPTNTPRPTTQPTPEIPVSGNTGTMGVIIIGASILFIVLGLAL